MARWPHPAVANTKGATNPGYCGDLDGREESFVASSCYLPSSRVLRPSLHDIPCTGATCTPADCCVDASGVLLNEILPTPSSAADPEWVEIFNAGATEVSLAGWTIEDGGGSVFWTGAAGSTIGAGGYFVAEGAVDANFFSNVGCTVVLRAADGTEMDRMAYTGTSGAAGQVPALLCFFATRPMLEPHTLSKVCTTHSGWEADWELWLRRRIGSGAAPGWRRLADIGRSSCGEHKGRDQPRLLQ
jgi:hypothetical protein